MHAYLIVGKDREKKEEKIKAILEKIKAERLSFPLQKRQDTKDLLAFTKLSISKKTAVVIEDIQTASLEALNAFLKNLEEAQENIFYIITADSLQNVIPTIISRCQVIKISGYPKPSLAEIDQIKEFLKSKTGKKFLFINKFRKREEAQVFINNFIKTCHYFLLKAVKNSKEKDRQKLGKITKSIALAKDTLVNLRANGNTQLQLTNFVIKLNRQAGQSLEN